MQDTQTGDMVLVAADTQEARDAALPRDRQGPSFTIGEPLEIRGGNFAVQSIGRKMLVLRSLPGTDVNVVAMRQVRDILKRLEDSSAGTTKCIKSVLTHRFQYPEEVCDLIAAEIMGIMMHGSPSQDLGDRTAADICKERNLPIPNPSEAST